MPTESIHDQHDSSSDNAPAMQNAEDLREHARTLAGSLAWMPSVRSSDVFQQRCDRLKTELQLAVGDPQRQVHTGDELLRQNATVLENCFSEVYSGLHGLQRIPHIRRADGAVVPRPLVIAEQFLAHTHYRCDAPLFTAYLGAFQEVTVLDLLELWTLVPAMKLVLLERLIEKRPADVQMAEKKEDAASCLDTLRRMNEASWSKVVEPLIGFEPILQKDPT